VIVRIADPEFVDQRFSAPRQRLASRVSKATQNPEEVPDWRRLVSSPIVEHALDPRRQRHAVRVNFNLFGKFQFMMKRAKEPS
jgi:hypothetical protein